MKYKRILITIALYGAAAYAAPGGMEAGQWTFTAQITSPMTETVHYDACNHGQSFADWMIKHSKTGSCHTESNDLQHFITECTEPMPNGMKVVTHIQGEITVNANGSSLNGTINGATILPNGMGQSTFSEQLSGKRVGACAVN